MQLKATQKFSVSVEGRDSKGNPAAFENPVFDVSPAEIGSFEVDPTNPAAGTFVAAGVGTGQLAFSADGVVGEGESLLTADLALTIVPGDAVSVQFNVGAVEEQ